MKYDVFMWTRTFDDGYEWLNKPEYITADVFKACQSIIALPKKESFNALSEEDWYSNFFYLRTKECCLFARIAKTAYSDIEGANIVSFEGVAVKSENEGRLFFNLPNLISGLFPPAKNFRAQFEDEDEGMPDTFQVDETLELFSADVPSEIHPALKNNPAFANLLKLVAFTDKPTGIIFGKNAKAFAVYVNQEKLKIEHVFDFQEPDPIVVDEDAFGNSYKPVTCEYNEMVPTGQDKVAVNLIVQETGDSYQYKWVVMPWDSSVKDSNRVRYSTKYYEIGEKVELAKLELEKEGIRKFLTENGWVKQQFGLRFEKDIFQREVT